MAAAVRSNATAALTACGSTAWNAAQTRSGDADSGGRLIASARNRGQRRLYLHAYAENVRLNDLVRAFGFRTRAEQDHPQRVIHELDLLGADRGE